MAESISGRLRTLLGNKSADVNQPDEAEPPAAPSARSANRPGLPPDVAVRRDTSTQPDASIQHNPPTGNAPFADVPPASPVLPTDLPGARAYQSELQRKMTVLAEDFSLGQINRQQFEAVYAHYREQLQVIDALINSLNVEAWHKAVNEGQTGLLLHQNAARLLGHALYDNTTGQPLAVSDHFKIDPAVLVPIAAAQHAAGDMQTRIITSELAGGQWLCCVPGTCCTLVALFSTEPARTQLQLLQDLHHDFELANAKRFRQGRGREVAEQFMQLWALEELG